MECHNSGRSKGTNCTHLVPHRLEKSTFLPIFYCENKPSLKELIMIFFKMEEISLFSYQSSHTENNDHFAQNLSHYTEILFYEFDQSHKNNKIYTSSKN